MFFGMSSDHGQAHFKRAVLEGVAFSLRSIIQMYRETMDLKIMRLIGGGAKSDLWSGIIADVCGVTIDRLTTPAGDATALGIALAAGVGVGLYPDMQTALQTIAVRDHRMADPAHQSLYDRLYPIFESLYGANRSLFSRLAQFRQEAGHAEPAKK